MKKDIIWNTAGNIVYNFCQWVITVIVVYLASYKDAGYLSLAMTTSSSFATITLFSMRNYQVSDIRHDFSASEYISSRTLTCLIGFVTCLIGALVGNSFYQVICIDAFMLLRVAEAISDVMQGEEQKFDRYDLIGKSCLLRGTASVLTFYILLKATDDLFLSILVMAVVSFIIVIAFDWNNTKKLEKFTATCFNKNVFILLKKCLPIVFFTFLLNLVNLIPKNVLQQINGTEILGYYSSMASPTLVVQILAAAVFNPVVPKIAAAYESSDLGKAKSILHRTYAGLLIMAIVVTSGGALLGRIGLKILYGNSVLKYYNYFLPIIFCTILLGSIWILYAVAVAFRKIKAIVIGMVISFIVLLVITYPLTKGLGMNGTSLAQIITYGIFIPYLIIACERALNERSTPGGGTIKQRHKAF